MPVEIEAKMKIDDTDAVRRKLKAAGARHTKKTRETNIFLDTEDRSLLAGDRGLRVRINRDVTTGSEKVIITFKGPRHPGPLKSRDESELEVASSADAVQLLACIGYRQIISFEKLRESWELMGCKIEIDEVPRIGTFLEIEGPTDDIVLKTRDALELGNKPIVKSSYISMLMADLQEKGESTRVIKFEK
jgi:adenylate cyclase class 2